MWKWHFICHAFGQAVSEQSLMSGDARGECSFASGTRNSGLVRAPHEREVVGDCLPSAACVIYTSEKCVLGSESHNSWARLLCVCVCVFFIFWTAVAVIKRMYSTCVPTLYFLLGNSYLRAITYTYSQVFIFTSFELYFHFYNLCGKLGLLLNTPSKKDPFSYLLHGWVGEGWG